jgi:hypothetical protein
MIDAVTLPLARAVGALIGVLVEGVLIEQLSAGSRKTKGDRFI